MSDKSGSVWIVVLVVSIAVGIVMTLGIRESVIAAYKMPARSMIPALLVGDHILVNKLIYGVKIPFSRINVTPVTSPKRGDIVVFIYPNDRTKDFVKRVIGVGGDKIEIKNKKIFINDKEYSDSYGVHSDAVIYPASQYPRDNYGPVAVPDKAIFVMGDNRDESLDSRFFGFVDLKDVRGKVVSIYWSWDKIEQNVRWDRIGLKVQ